MAYRYDIALIAFVVYLPVVVSLGLARCPRCQGFFFNEWLLLAWGPWRVFARRPSCSRCGLGLHECQGAVDA